jgi:hypothetical protein
MGAAVGVVWLTAGAILAGSQGRVAGRTDADARALVERSRAAVAPAGAAGVRSVILRGRVRHPTEGNLFDEGQVEIRVLLPDQFRRVDTFDGAPRLSKDRAFFTRFLAGALAFLVPGEKLAVRSTGEEAFEDTAAVDVAGPAFSARLVFELASMIPMRLTYFEKGTVSTVMSFADRRPVDGVLIPFRVSTQVPQRVLETLMFDEVLVNPPLARGDFKP